MLYTDTDIEVGNTTTYFRRQKMKSPVDRLVEAADGVVQFLEQYPPHFHDGRSMWTDFHEYLNELRESADNLRERREANPPTELDQLEAESLQLFELCGKESGRPAYPALDAKRKKVLAEIEKHRTLTRWEFINRYEYQAWLDHCETHGLAEDHPDADKPWFRNYYECPDDGEEWEDEHSCQCNDRCPSCNKEIEPYKSDTLDFDTGEVLEEGSDCRELTPT